MVSEGVLIAVVASSTSLVGVIITAILAPLLLRINRHVKVAAGAAVSANEQVTNDHSTNLRVESDERHHENISRIGKLEELAETTAKAVLRIERHLGITPHNKETP